VCVSADETDLCHAQRWRTQTTANQLPQNQHLVTEKNISHTPLFTDQYDLRLCIISVIIDVKTFFTFFILKQKTRF